MWHDTNPNWDNVLLKIMMQNTESQVWIRNLYGVQLNQPALQRQTGLAHQVRNLSYADECRDIQFAPRILMLTPRPFPTGFPPRLPNPVPFSTSRQSRGRVVAKKEVGMGNLNHRPLHHSFIKENDFLILDQKATSLNSRAIIHTASLEIAL